MCLGRRDRDVLTRWILLSGCKNLYLDFPLYMGGSILMNDTNVMLHYATVRVLVSYSCMLIPLILIYLCARDAVFLVKKDGRWKL